MSENNHLTPVNRLYKARIFEMLYSDDDLKKKLGVAAKERSQSFSANVMAIKYINVYKM